MDEVPFSQIVALVHEIKKKDRDVVAGPRVWNRTMVGAFDHHLEKAQHCPAVSRLSETDTGLAGPTHLVVWVICFPHELLNNPLGGKWFHPTNL